MNIFSMRRECFVYAICMNIEYRSMSAEYSKYLLYLHEVNAIL